MSNAYVDADGHVMEDAEEILKFVRAPFNNRGTRNGYRVWIIFTPRRMAHRARLVRSIPILGQSNGSSSLIRRVPITRCSIRPRDWPTAMIAYPQWAVAYAQGYNDYIHARYLKRSPRFQAVALIPMQSESRCRYRAAPRGQRSGVYRGDDSLEWAYPSC